VGRELENLTRDFEGIHFPNGNANVPIMRLDQHAGETLQLVNQQGFYVVMLNPATANPCSFALSQDGAGIYTLQSANGSTDARVIYLNTNSYKIAASSNIKDCILYN
jgi:hypothetical protein